MKVGRLLALALTVACAVSALTASTAAAIPKFRLPITRRGFTALRLNQCIHSPGNSGRHNNMHSRYSVRHNPW